MMRKKSTTGGCEYIFPRDLLQLLVTKMPFHSVSSSHLPEDIAQTQKEESYIFSTATLVNVKRFPGEQLSNSIPPDGPSRPKRSGQPRGTRPFAQSPVPLPAPRRAAPLAPRRADRSAETRLLPRANTREITGLPCTNSQPPHTPAGQSGGRGVVHQER